MIMIKRSKISRNPSLSHPYTYVTLTWLFPILSFRSVLYSRGECYVSVKIGECILPSLLSYLSQPIPSRKAREGEGRVVC